MDNRRQTKRYRVRMHGDLFLNSAHCAVEMVNMSTGGARIGLDAPLLEGTRVSLVLRLPAPYPEPSLRMDGVVVWCAEDMDAGYEAGISFNLSEAVATRLDAFLITHCS